MDDLSLAQQQLDKSLRQARAGEDRELAGRIREDGLRFGQLFMGLLRLTRVHALDNHAFDKPLEEFAHALEELSGLLGAVHLVTVEDQVYVNDVRLRFDDRGEGPDLKDLLQRHRVGGVSFHAPLQVAEARALVEAFAGAPGARRALRAELGDRGLSTVQLFGVFRFRMAGDGTPEAPRMTSEQAVTRARGAIAEAWDNLAAGRIPNPLPLRRSVTDMLEAGLDAEGLLVTEENRHGAHTSRVARIAMLIGSEVGLSQGHLQDLGVAALFHDVGYTAREGAVPGGHPGYAPPFERHAAAGARMLLRQRGFHEARIHRIRAILEHHDDCHGSSVFGRILRIAEDFDNLSNSERCMGSPAVALGSMAGSAGTAYDPLLFQALVNRLGPYPPGTLLQLTDGRVVHSASLVRSPEPFAKPLCVLAQTASGQRPAERIEIDIAEGEGQIARLHLG